MRKTALACIHELARGDKRVVFIGSDLGAGTMAAFGREFPDRFFMEGISEASIVGMAAGMAMEGKVVYVNTIAPFLSRRAFEQIVLDCCLHYLPVRLVGNGGGMVYAPLGPTHMCTEDIAVLRAVPDMTVIAPADADEMRRLMPQTLDWPGPIYIRLAKGFDPVVTRDRPAFVIGKALLYRQGADVLLLSTGITLATCLAAADALAQADVSASVLHVPTVKPLDFDTIVTQAASVRAVVSVEEHSVIGGLGGAVAEILAEARLRQPLRMSRIGVPDCFPDRYGSQKELLRHYGITPEKVAAAARALLSDML